MYTVRLYFRDIFRLQQNIAFKYEHLLLGDQNGAERIGSLARH